jgi:hypothetical protein
LNKLKKSDAKFYNFLKKQDAQLLAFVKPADGDDANSISASYDDDDDDDNDDSDDDKATKTKGNQLLYMGVLSDISMTLTCND